MLGIHCRNRKYLGEDGGQREGIADFWVFLFVLHLASNIQCAASRMKEKHLLEGNLSTHQQRQNQDLILKGAKIN